MVSVAGMATTAHPLVLPDDRVPDGRAALNAFVIVDDAAGLISFITDVFGVPETPEARTPMPDGRLIHAEVQFGAVSLMFCDRLDRLAGPARPAAGLVGDVATILARGAERGARTITEPTPFYGETTIARMLDPWGDLWWLFAPAPGQPDPTPFWDGGSNAIFSTVDETLRSIARG